MKIQILGAVVKTTDPESALSFLKTVLPYETVSHENGFLIKVPGCGIFIENDPSPCTIQTHEEGYYTGLSHIAFRCANPARTVKDLQEAGISFENDGKINFNPAVWGTGMVYVNPKCPLGFGLEFCQRLDLPELPDSDNVCFGTDHIGIPVPEISNSISWYEKLGFHVKSNVTICREEDRATIYNVMMEGGGVTLELYEFAGMKHEPWRGQPFYSLRFIFSDDNVSKQLAEAGAHIDSNGMWILKAPGGERLEFMKGAETN